LFTIPERCVEDVYAIVHCGHPRSDLSPVGMFRRVGHKTIIKRDFGLGKFIML
jgi:hypothetical protein